MKTTTMAEARANLRALLDEVEATHERVIITRRGHAPAVILSVEDLEALEETLEILGDPEAMAALRQAEAEVAAGQVVPLEQVAQDMRRDLAG